jgi:hypothetical protein
MPHSTRYSVCQGVSRICGANYHDNACTRLCVHLHFIHIRTRCAMASGVIPPEVTWSPPTKFPFVTACKGKDVCALGIRAYRGARVSLHSFLTSALDGREWPVSRLGRVTPDTHWREGWSRTQSLVPLPALKPPIKCPLYWFFEPETEEVVEEEREFHKEKRWWFVVLTELLWRCNNVESPPKELVTHGAGNNLVCALLCSVLRPVCRLLVTRHAGNNLVCALLCSVLRPVCRLLVTRHAGNNLVCALLCSLLRPVCRLLVTRRARNNLVCALLCSVLRPVCRLLVTRRATHL